MEDKKSYTEDEIVEMMDTYSRLQEAYGRTSPLEESKELVLRRECYQNIPERIQIKLANRVLAREKKRMDLYGESGRLRKKANSLEKEMKQI